MPSLSPAQAERLHQALKPLHAQYDPEERMIRRPFSSPGYHTTLTGGFVHPTRESLNYAVALLDTGDPELERRAEAILRRVIALQDPNPESKTYGIWSWFLEEPLEKMSPPDWNWADFCGVQLLQVTRDHRERLPEDLRKAVDESIRHAANAIRKRNVGPGYTNIAIMGTYVTLVAAETYGLDDMKAYAMERLRRFHDYTLNHGAFTEYNSPTYTVVALTELGRLRKDAEDPEARRMTETLYRMAWEEIAQHFHPPTRQWAGPHSRAYRTLLPASVLNLIRRASAGRVRFEEKGATSGDSTRENPAPSLDEHRVPLPLPRDLERYFTSLSAPREIVKTFTKGEGEKPPVVGTTYLAPAFALGSVNRGDLWNQRRSLLAYWGTAEDPSYLHLRFLHDGYDFAAAQFFSAQKGGVALAGINFATDGGDRHVSLDRIKDATFRAKDLRLRFEFGGAAGKNVLEAPERLADPVALRFRELNVSLSVPYATLGTQEGKWETGRDAEKGIAWLDVALYSDEGREFRLSDLERAAVGLAVRLSDRRAAPLKASANVEDGRLRLGLADSPLTLSLPVKPGTAAGLQRAYRTEEPQMNTDEHR
ncbi:MAG: hypothetical protein KY468_11380 [Armatimonadetes bacterium]|nr:hypothetical protein [Armatimonadota bacterium]